MQNQRFLHPNAVVALCECRAKHVVLASPSWLSQQHRPGGNTSLIPCDKLSWKNANLMSTLFLFAATATGYQARLSNNFKLIYHPNDIATCSPNSVSQNITSLRAAWTAWPSESKRWWQHCGLVAVGHGWTSTFGLGVAFAWTCVICFVEGPLPHAIGCLSNCWISKFFMRNEDCML